MFHVVVHQLEYQVSTGMAAAWIVYPNVVTAGVLKYGFMKSGLWGSSRWHAIRYCTPNKPQQP